MQSVGRPKKDGIEWFQHFSDAHTDIKLQNNRAMASMAKESLNKDMESICALAADGFYWGLVERIYLSVEGFIVLKEDYQKLALAREFGICLDTFNYLLDGTLKTGLFDNNLFQNECKLTSNGIQKRRTPVIEARLKWQEQNEKRRLEKQEKQPKPKKIKESKPTQEVQLPTYIDREIWDRFIQMRKEIKHPLTPTAISQVLKNADKANNEGIDVNACFEKSIANNWQGVFFEPDKKQKAKQDIPDGMSPVWDEWKQNKKEDGAK
jgi:hypothetical protein